jgi:hypothetical protein
MARQQTQNSAAAQQWHKLPKTPGFFQQMSLLESLGQDLRERAAVLSRLHKMWGTYDPLRRPEIAYLMCQLGDLSGVEEVAKAFFAGDYDVERELEPDGDAAGANATDSAYRMLILYGTPQHHQRLLAFLKLSDDPLRKGDNLCEILLGLSSTNEGPGLPIGYFKEKFPLELAVACLDYTEEAGTLVIAAPGATVHSQVGPRQGSVQEGSITISEVAGVYAQRRCDYAAQTIQNVTSGDFGHRVSNPIASRDEAIEAIKKWWTESHSGAPPR